MVRIYVHARTSMPKLPQKAWSFPMDCGRLQSSVYSSPSLTTTGVGRKGARCALIPTGPARRGEGLVQIEVADVEPEVARARDAEDGVEVGAVHVHLHTLGVTHLGDLVDLRLEEPERVGLGDHEG